MRETRSPVILIAHIKEAIEDGAWIEIDCVETADRGGNTHRGGWTVNVCTVDGSGKVAVSMYVTGRGLKPRVFKTVAGLMSFAIDVGLDPFVCPLREGTKVTWAFETSKIPPDR